MAKLKQPEPENALNLVESVTAAVHAMHWLEDSDQALVGLAIRYAERIEEAAAEGGQTSYKMVGWLGPHLTHTLKSLGGAPAERKALGVEKAVKGRLAELRAARDERAS